MQADLLIQFACIMTNTLRVYNVIYYMLLRAILFLVYYMLYGTEK